MKKVYLDTNFVIDLLVREERFSVPAKRVLRMAAKYNIEFFISFLSIANFAYIMRKERQEDLYGQIRLLCSLFTVVPNEEAHLISALDVDAKDYEDALQYQTALGSECECIITRNVKHYKFSQLPIYTPEEFIDYLTGK